MCVWHGGVTGTMEGGGGGSCTQSALREGLLDLIQHIPKQRRLIAFRINGHGLTRLEMRGKKKAKLDTRFLQKPSGFKTVLTHSFDQQTDVVTLDRPAVHGGTGVDPFHNYSIIRGREDHSI